MGPGNWLMLFHTILITKSHKSDQETSLKVISGCRPHSATGPLLTNLTSFVFLTKVELKWWGCLIIVFPVRSA